MFSDTTKAFMLAVWWTLFKREVFQILHGYNLAWGLAIHFRFVDFDFISKSQVCKNHKLQIVFRFLLTVV